MAPNVSRDPGQNTHEGNDQPLPDDDIRARLHAALAETQALGGDIDEDPEAAAVLLAEARKAVAREKAERQQ